MKSPIESSRRPAAPAALCLAAVFTASLAATPAHAGTLAGTVQFTGTPPVAKPLPVTQDVDFCGKHPILDQAVLVSSSGGLANVMVWVDGIPATAVAPTPNATLANDGCRYVPHVQVVATGTKLQVKNEDPVLHNTHARFAKRDVFNFALPKQGQVLTKTLDTAGLMKVGCDAGHDWMNAYIAVFDHPYFAVSRADGTFTIANVPAGSHQIVFWHEKLGRKTQTVTVAEGDASVAVTYP
jgi:hypothetical protein